MGAAQRSSSGLRLLVTVTFNPNQLKAHLLPLIALDEVESITVVSDVATPQLPKVRGVVPSLSARRILGRAGAKLAVCHRLARQQHFDWVVGFNLVPHGFNAIRVATRAQTQSLYQMIGGEREWLGGGYLSDNRVLSKLPMPIPLLERAMLGMMGRATLVATMGPTVRSLLVEQGLDEQRVVVIPPATDSARFARSPALAPRYAAVSVAALIERKRVHDLVEAAAALRERHPAARFAVAGSGPQLTALERRAAELGVADRIDFLGHVDRVEDVLGNALAFVLPSAAEGLPIGMLDAMAASLPIVATPVGEIPDVIRPGENGFLFDVGDVDALTGQLDALLSYPATARRLGEEARRDVVARYSIEAVSDIYSQLLR